MNTSKLHNLKKLLSEGIDIPSGDYAGETMIYPIAGILIPRIQRPYAQGRSDKNIIDIRRDFVEKLLSVVSSRQESTIELSFIFGSLQKVNWNDPHSSQQALEVLDGQQRLTTLFLLHWYLYKKECPEEMPEWLSRFRYETRDTSTAFLAKITDKSSTIDLNAVADTGDNRTSSTVTPSEAITRLIWYNNDFRCDTTVVSMLRMLDEIDAQYKSMTTAGRTSGRSFHKNLDRIQFYVRLLLGFDMPDLLFIKMNSRGLPLIPFENFKADVIRYMTKAKTYEEPVEIENGQSSPFHFYFASLVDTKWIYLFWQRPESPSPGTIIKLDDRHTGARFFRFFNRMLFTKLAIDYAESEDAVEKSKVEAACNFFSTVAETDMEEHITDWNTQYLPAISRWSGDDDFFRQSARVLNFLFENYTSGFNLREAVRKSPFTATFNFEIYSKLNVANGTFTYVHRAFLSVIVDFILLAPKMTSAVERNLWRLIRVLHNVLEYTEVGNSNILDFIKAFHKILRSDGAITGNFYDVLKKYDGEFAWIKAESAKAEDICRDETFEPIMVKGEVHPVLRGRLTPLYRSGEMTTEELAEHVAEFYRIFPVDEDGICMGIAGEYASSGSHLLIRAMMSYLTNWDKLDGTYVTERGYVIRSGVKVNSKYLSDILFGKGKSERLFREYFFRRFETQDFCSYLSEMIGNAACDTEADDGTEAVYNRLVTDFNSPKIYDWIRSREQVRTGKEPVIRWLKDSGVLNYDKTGFDRLVLTTSRRYLIPQILKLTDAALEDKNQAGHLERFGEYYAYDVSIMKVVCLSSGQNIVIKTTFHANSWCKIYVESPDQAVHKTIQEDRHDDQSYKWLSYKEKDSAYVIAKTINDWAEKLQTII